MEHSFGNIELIDDPPWSKFITLWKRNIGSRHSFKDKNLPKNEQSSVRCDKDTFYPNSSFEPPLHFFVYVETKLY